MFGGAILQVALKKSCLFCSDVHVLYKLIYIYVRTSYLVAEAEPKLNVLFFFFHVLNLKRS